MSEINSYHLVIIGAIAASESIARCLLRKLENVMEAYYSFRRKYASLKAQFQPDVEARGGLKPLWITFAYYTDDGISSGVHVLHVQGRLVLPVPRRGSEDSTSPQVDIREG